MTKQPQPPSNPEAERAAAEAQRAAYEDKALAQQDRAAQMTRNMLLKFGTSAALSKRSGGSLASI
jgi:hypothetical protein